MVKHTCLTHFSGGKPSNTVEIEKRCTSVPKILFSQHIVECTLSQHYIYHMLYIYVLYNHVNPTLHVYITLSTGTGQDVVYASIPDLTRVAATSSRHTYASLNNGGQNKLLYTRGTDCHIMPLDNKQNAYQLPSGIGIKKNPVHLPETRLPTWIQDQKEMECAMDSNPLYAMRLKMTTKPNGANTSPVHHYDYIAV